ncbi:MAG: type IX secretion system protein PorQ [Saprospiraceae bacterium]|nr:type IX secretion system protein PorQ [Saprospiraceae bacterium]
MSKILPVIFLVAFSVSLSGQIGGRSVFTFLNTPNSARAAGMGGYLITSPATDISLALDNPALITDDLDGQLSFQHQFLQSGIQSGYAGIGKNFPSRKIMAHAGVKYILYGTFDQTDEFGNITGSFKGSELALQVGTSYLLYDKMRIGANLKFIQSSLEVYNSSGLAVDLGAFYQDTASGFGAALVIKQAGLQLTAFDEVRESLPLDIQLGLSKKLTHLPFRFFITWHHLNRWNLLYDDPNTEEDTFFGGLQPLRKEPTQADNFFRHMIFGGEMVLGKKESFKIRLGYNHQLKQELSVLTLRSFAGFSFGFGVKVKKFQFDYSNSVLHFGGSSHHIGLSTNLRYFTGNGIL